MRIVDALPVEKRLLRYDGISYGSVLGAYTAALFPDRIERMVLDGNFSPKGYQRGDLGALHVDAKKTFDAFLSGCLANKEKCRLAQVLRAETVNDMLEAINERLLVLTPEAGESSEMSKAYWQVSNWLLNDMFDPKRWPKLASDMAEHLTGHEKSLAFGLDPETQKQSRNRTVHFQPPVGPDFGEERTGIAWPFYGILSSDALHRVRIADELLPLVKFEDEMSPFDAAYDPYWVSAR